MEVIPKIFMPAISIRNLCYRYPDGTVALDGVSLEIPHGSSVAVIGGNGAGKSTLLMHLNGSLLPQKGCLEIGGMEISRASRDQIRMQVGMVFQNADDQLFMPTVWEDVAFGPFNMGLGKEEVRSRVHSALGQVDAWDLRDKAPYHLSGGEKRRVAIATVLSMEPDILVMDEPGSGLDPFARRNLIGILGGMRQTRVIATHDLDMALDVCTHCVALSGGRLMAAGPVETVFADRGLLESCRLEQPWRLRAPAPSA